MFGRGLCAGLLLVVAACHEVNENVEQRPPELVVYDGATAVRGTAERDGRYTLTYRVDALFPAAPVVDRIRSLFPGDRWQPLAQDWLNPGNPSGHSRGWSEFIDATKTPKTDVHAWSAEWKDTAGNIVMYSLRYDSVVSSASLTRETPDNSDLEVTVIFIPAAVVSAMRKELGITEPIR
jgi:hypothetical protein